MKQIAFQIFLFILLAAPSLAQRFEYPSVPAAGKSVADFIPVGWTMLDSAFGDLNRDSLQDCAIILQYADSVEILKADEDTVLTQPRVLLIFFKTEKGHFRLIHQNNSFVLNHHSPTMDDPYQDLTITKGALRLKFQLFYTMGSWYVTDLLYIFRYEDGEFVLIGADYYSLHRASRDFEQYSFNFLTKKRSYTKGKAGKRTNKPAWKPIKTELKNLRTLKEPLTWEVEKDFYL